VIDHPTLELPVWRPPTHALEVHLPSLGGFQITRYMVVELISAALMILIFTNVVAHIRKNQVSRGWFMNLFETILLFIRDQIARPAIGGHGADKYVPYLWTVFFFVLFNNLLGLVPGLASPTGNISVTGVLAIMTFLIVLVTGMRESGVFGYWIALVPKIDVIIWLKIPIWLLMFVIEIAGLLIRHFVLAVRLFANMFAGHIVLTVILGFILLAEGAAAYIYFPIVGVSLAGVVMLSLLELLVAFLQAYIFTYLSALFIGQSAHPH
jgi:F-type H+-transporting ATPase subunit a